MKRKFDNVVMPPEINYVVKNHKFYVEECNKAVDLLNVKMIEYYNEQIRICERQIAANLYQYIY